MGDDGLIFAMVVVVFYQQNVADAFLSFVSPMWLIHSYLGSQDSYLALLERYEGGLMR